MSIFVVLVLPKSAVKTAKKKWHIIYGNFAAHLWVGIEPLKTKSNQAMAKKVNVTPLHDRVIVKAAAAEEKTAGGIIIPDTAKEKPQRGTVIAAGPGKKDEPVTVKAGDTVLYGKYAGTEIQIEGEDYLIMRESDILAIV